VFGSNKTKGPKQDNQNRLEVTYASFVYICITVGDGFIKKECWYLIYFLLILPHFSAGPKPNVMVFFVFDDVRWEEICCFSDIHEIVDYHCLIFLDTIL